MITKEQAAVLVKTAVDGILKQQGEKKTWNQLAHLSMLRNVIIALPVEKEAKDHKANVGLVLDAGNAGNASQFRQKLEKDKVIVKTDTVADEYQ
jgi:hypothetical protein